MPNELMISNKSLSLDQVDLIKRTVAKGATDDELSLFINVANRTGLDPFTHQIHFIKRRTWNKEARKYDEIGSIQTGIDGYRSIAARTHEHAGTDDAIIEEKDGLPVKASVTVYRMIGGERRPFTATARFSEYVQKAKTKDGDEYTVGMWAKMPFSQLAKCAESLALRKAFPNEIADIRSDEEMQQADTVETPKKRKEKVIEVLAEPVDEKVTVNSMKSRITLLMKQAGLQPNENTPEAWARVVKANFDLELIEENYAKIIEALEATNQQPE
jgi:phage recombination protein Bet